jgi:hypothetical protein
VKAEDKEEPVVSKEAQEEEPAETLEEENVEAELEEVLAEESAEETPETEEAEETSAPAEEEEEAKPSKKKKKEDEDIVEERTYTIPLGKALIRPPKKRAPGRARITSACDKQRSKRESLEQRHRETAAENPRTRS